jgi:mono/diheme cytochrome c family protein
VLTLAACSASQGPSVPAAYQGAAPPAEGFLSGAENIEAGRHLYQRHCATCHGQRGRGDGVAGRSLPVSPADLSHPNLNQKPLDYWFWRVSEGGTVEPLHSQGSTMPAWKFQLSERERWQVIAYARTLHNHQPK